MGRFDSHILGDSFNCTNVSQYNNLLHLLSSQMLILEYVHAALVDEVGKLTPVNFPTPPTQTLTTTIFVCLLPIHCLHGL